MTEARRQVRRHPAAVLLVQVDVSVEHDTGGHEPIELAFKVGHPQPSTVQGAATILSTRRRFETPRATVQSALAPVGLESVRGPG